MAAPSGLSQEVCRDCMFWDGGPAGPIEMEEIGLCQRISGEGTDAAFVVENGDFMCSADFGCTEYQPNEQQSLGFGDEAGIANPAQRAGPGGRENGGQGFPPGPGGPLPPF